MTDPSRAVPSILPARLRSAATMTSVLHIACILFALYTLLPLFWIVVASTKTNESLIYSFGLWFSGKFAFFDNLREIFAFQGGAYLRWFLNTIFYSGVSALGATGIATIGGFALAKYRFRGQALILGVTGLSIMVPTTALALPVYLLMSRIHLINNPAAIILPSLVSPFGLFLMTLYISAAVPNELLEAATIDGAGGGRVLLRVVFPLVTPAVVTVLLFSLVSTWNNYFLPLIVFSKSSTYPATVGLSIWSQLANGGGAGTQILYTMIACGGLITMAPLVIAFVVLQRYWKRTIAMGGMTG